MSKRRMIMPPNAAIPPPPEVQVAQLTKHVPMPVADVSPAVAESVLPGGMLNLGQAVEAPNAMGLREAIAAEQRPKPSAAMQFTPEAVGLKGMTEGDFAQGNVVRLPTAIESPPANPKLVRLLVEQALEQMDLGELAAYPEMHGDNLTVSWRTRPKAPLIEIGDEEDE